jgi:hypothetical protein
LGIGDWGLGPIPNPQSPIPNPQSPIPNNILIIILNYIRHCFNLLINNKLKAIKKYNPKNKNER